MPFKSKAQQKWMFANHPQMANRWADHTPNIKGLPEKARAKKKCSQAAKTAASLPFSSTAATVNDTCTGLQCTGVPVLSTGGRQILAAYLQKRAAMLPPTANRQGVMATSPVVPSYPQIGGNTAAAGMTNNEPLKQRSMTPPGRIPDGIGTQALGNLKAMSQPPRINPSDFDMINAAPGASASNAEVLGSPIGKGKMGNGPGVNFSGAGTQSNFMGQGLPKAAEDITTSVSTQTEPQDIAALVKDKDDIRFRSFDLAENKPATTLPTKQANRRCGMGKAMRKYKAKAKKRTKRTKRAAATIPSNGGDVMATRGMLLKAARSIMSDVKLAGYWSEAAGAGLNPANLIAGNLIGGLAALTSKTKSYRDVAESDVGAGNTALNLLVPGVAPYRMAKRLGASVRGPDIKEEKIKSLDRQRAKLEAEAKGEKSEKEANVYSEYASQLNPLNNYGGGLIGSLAALFTPTKTLAEQADNDTKATNSVIDLAVPGVGSYRRYKRLGNSIRGPEIKRERAKVKIERLDKQKKKLEKKGSSEARDLLKAGAALYKEALTPLQTALIGGGIGMGGGALAAKKGKRLQGALGGGLLGAGLGGGGQMLWDKLKPLDATSPYVTRLRDALKSTLDKLRGSAAAEEDPFYFPETPKAAKPPVTKPAPIPGDPFAFPETPLPG